MPEHIQRYIVWSTDRLDLSDPFQRRWWLRQVLTYWRAENIRALDFDEVERELIPFTCPRQSTFSGVPFSHSKMSNNPRPIIGKGLLTPDQRRQFFPILLDNLPAHPWIPFPQPHGRHYYGCAARRR